MERQDQEGPGLQPPSVPTQQKNCMELPATEVGVLLRIFVGDSDREPESGRLLHEALVMRARAMGMRGATVLRGTLGYGRHAILHSAKRFDDVVDMPMIIELVDSEARVREYLAAVDPMVTDGLATLEKVHVLAIA